MIVQLLLLFCRDDLSGEQCVDGGASVVKDFNGLRCSLDCCLDQTDNCKYDFWHSISFLSGVRPVLMPRFSVSHSRDSAT